MLKFADLILEPESYRVRRNGHVIHITAFQFQLLKFFVENPYRVFSLTELGKVVWAERQVNKAAVQKSIMRLRKLINASGGPNLIRSVRCIGYSLDLE